MSNAIKDMRDEFVNDMDNAIAFELSTEKPPQYSCLKIDTFERIKADATKEEAIGFCKYNIDKYTHRKKGCDADDLKKIKDYVELWLWALENK